MLAGEKPNIFPLDFSDRSLVDVGLYPIYVAVALFGEPASASYDPVIVRTGIDWGRTCCVAYQGFPVMVGQFKVYTSALAEVYGEGSWER